MKKEHIIEIVEKLKTNSATNALYNNSTVSDNQIKGIVMFLEQNRIIKFTDKPITFEDGQFATKVEFIDGYESRLDAIIN